MAPTQGAAGIAIAQSYHLLHVELIVTMIERQEQAVVFAQGLRHLGVQVIKIDVGFVQVLAQERQDQTRIGGSSCNHHRGLVVEQGSLQHQSAGHQAHTTLYPEALGHLVFHRHVKDRGKTPAKISRDVTFIKRGVFHHVVVKHREES